MALGALLYGAGLLCFGFSTAWIHLAFAIAIFTLGEIQVLATVTSAVSHMAPQHMIGRYMGMTGLVTGLSRAVGPYIGSVIYDQLYTRPVLLWGLFTTIALLSGLGFLSLSRNDRTVITGEHKAAEKKELTPA